MSQAKHCSTSRVLVIGAQGVLGGIAAQAFESAGWAVVRSGRRPDPSAGFRHVRPGRARDRGGSDRRGRPRRQHGSRARADRRENGARPGRDAHQCLGHAGRGRPVSSARGRYGAGHRRHERGHRPRADQPHRGRPAGCPPGGRRGRARLHCLDQEHQRTGGRRLRPPRPDHRQRTARRSFRCPRRSACAAALALPSPMAAGWAAW